MISFAFTLYLSVNIYNFQIVLQTKEIQEIPETDSEEEEVQIKPRIFKLKRKFSKGNLKVIYPYYNIISDNLSICMISI